MSHVSLSRPFSNHVFWRYSYLQLLDLLTTLAFLTAGVQEANWLVRQVISCTGNSAMGLVAVKLAALLIGWLCVFSGREKLMSRVNVFFALLIVWNLVALLLTVGRS
jgi:hypothetical protein